MTSRSLQHRRTHHLLLFHNLLIQREASSLFTLVLDTIEQTAKALLSTAIRNAKEAKHNIVFVSFETLRQRVEDDVTEFISARRKGIDMLLEEIKTACSAAKRTLLVIDTLHPICLSSPSLFQTLQPLISPTTFLIAVYHTDIHLPNPYAPGNGQTDFDPNPYAPHPLTTLKHMATTILTCHSLPQTLVRKRASDLGKPEPLFGLREYEEGREGVVVGLPPPASLLPPKVDDAMVVEMLHRRRSGREMEETFILPFPTPSPASSTASGTSKGKVGARPKVTLLADHEFFRADQEGGAGGGGDEGGIEDGTFKLSLSEKERRDREGVVLPHYDAQRESGIGEGGRILYQMGVEDDFDEEEDEI